jgi:predicted transcriptional regulator
MSRPVHTCRPEDDVRVALERMANARVRRLPVVAEDGDVKGLVSIDDLVLWGLQSSGVGMHALIAALRALCATSGFAARDYGDERRR